jgi:uncharacterized membrane-anchored protein YitT (DUF2179 family)
LVKENEKREQKKMQAKTKKEYPVIVELLIIIIGTLISACGLNMLIIPSKLLSGGLTGISQFINYFFPINVGIFYFILNIPLMILGYKHIGKKFSIYTIFSITLLSVTLYIIPIRHIWTDNILLSAVFGGILSSFGSAIVLRVGGSQGGLDILSRIVAKYNNISVGKVSLMINAIIIAISGFIFNSEIALYTIISIYSAAKTYEVILNHVNRVSVMIITEKGKEVGEKINGQLHRGTTVWNANGGYTNKDKTVLFCVIVEGELNQLKQIVKTIDPESFVSVNSTQNVIGRFNQIW